MENFGIGQFGGPPPGLFESFLTQEKRETLEEILKKYDATNLSQSDKEALRQEIQEAGIRPGPSLGQALTDAGFDPNALRPSGPPPGLAEIIAANQDDEEDSANGLQGMSEDLMTLLQMLVQNAEDPEIQQSLEEFVEELQNRYSSVGGLVNEEA